MIVSSIFIQRDNRTTHSIEKYEERFSMLCQGLHDLGRNILLFHNYETKLNLPNLFKLRIKLEDLETFHILNQATSIMQSDNPSKNTLDYHIIMNSKIELLNKASDLFYYEPRLYWIDAGIFHILKSPSTSLLNLNRLGSSPPGILIPGAYTRIDDFLHCPNWRFCGGFFGGDVKSLKEMYELSIKSLKSILPIATWEVNVWAYMEKNLNWKPNWYPGNHNDSILDIPNYSSLTY